jgi:hypothetical protein
MINRKKLIRGQPVNILDWIVKEEKPQKRKAGRSTQTTLYKKP